jgi:hypothetical protein
MQHFIMLPLAAHWHWRWWHSFILFFFFMIRYITQLILIIHLTKREECIRDLTFYRWVGYSRTAIRKKTGQEKNELPVCVHWEAGWSPTRASPAGRLRLPGATHDD